MSNRCQVWQIPLGEGGRPDRLIENKSRLIVTQKGQKQTKTLEYSIGKKNPKIKISKEHKNL